MKYAVCDDDALARDTITGYIKEYYKTNNLTNPDITQFASGDELLEASDTYNIVFLDIEMKGRSGISVGSYLRTRHPRTLVIYVTAYNNYLDEAMRVKAFRFISKPIDKSRFMGNFHDALHTVNTLDSKVAIICRHKVISMYATDIIMIFKYGRCVMVYTRQGHYESTEPLSHYIETLSPDVFFQSSKGYLINLKYVDEFNDSKVHLFHGRYEAYVTKRKFAELRKAYLLYINSIT